MTNQVKRIVRVDVYHDADWDDATFLPLDGTRPRDLTDKILELTVLPDYDYPTPMRVFTSDGLSPRIIIDDPTHSGFYFAVPQAVIASDLEVGEWVHFLNLIDGAARIELWRGPFVVNAGRLA